MFRSLRRLACLALLTGCSSFAETEKDFAEIWRGRLGLGPGLRVHLGLGDLVHAGVGVSGTMSQEFAYGQAKKDWVFADADAIFHWQQRIQDFPDDAWRTPECDRCFTLLPVLTNTRVRPWIHRLDLELEVDLLILDIGVGISLGQLLDFFTSLFGWDLDPEAPADKDQRENGLLSPLWSPRGDSGDRGVSPAPGENEKAK